MEVKVALNGLHLTLSEVEEKTIISEPTGNMLRFFKFSTRSQGLDLKNQLADILNKPSFVFKSLDSDQIEFKAKGSQDWSYTGPLNDNTIITSTITIEELDKDLPEDHNALASTGSAVIMNWIRTRALSSILIKNGLCTEDEYLKEIKEIEARDFENLRKLIRYGIPEPEKK